MKQAFFIICSVVLYNCTMAQDIRENEVPVIVREAFTKESRTSKVQWSKEENGYEASFKTKVQESSIVFDVNGNVIERETEISKSELPAFVTDFLSNNYTGFKHDEFAKIESEKGVFFEVEISKGKTSYELLFDAHSLVEKKEAKDKD